MVWFQEPPTPMEQDTPLFGYLASSLWESHLLTSELSYDLQDEHLPTITKCILLPSLSFDMFSVSSVERGPWCFCKSECLVVS